MKTSAGRQPLFIFVCVAALHALALGWAFWGQTPDVMLPKQQRLLVKTVALKGEKGPVKRIAAAAPVVKNETTQSAPPIPPVQKEKAAPTPKKAEPAAKPNKAQEPQKKSVPPVVKNAPVPANKSPLVRDQNLIAQVKESVAKIQRSGDKSSASAAGKSAELKDLTLIDSLQIDIVADCPAEDAGYYGQLSGFLRNALRLPEQGEVKVTLTLGREGQVLQVAIRSSASDYNQRYVEKTLATLRFPPFGSHFKKDAKRTFNLTLVNEH